MSFNPCRQRDSAVGIHDRRKPADAHRGSRQDFLRRHEMDATEAAKGDSAAKHKFVAMLFSRVFHHHNLRAALDYLASECGQGAGPDGLTYTDLAEWDNWELVRTLSNAIEYGTYRPGPDRVQRILKTSGRGYRTLTYRSILDRVVERAVVQILQPYLDPGFDLLSFGYRPRLGVNHALAHAERLAVEQENWVWTAEDLQDAFDTVPQERLLQILRNRIPEARMIALLELLIRTGSGRGLRQGGNLSPFLLNLYLDHVLDRPWRKRHAKTPLLRWADDLLDQAPDRITAIQCYQQLDQLLRPAGMRLKGTPGNTIHDLKADDFVDWLGYRIECAGDRLRLTIQPKSWDRLTEELESCQTKHDSVFRAISVVRGWVGFLGPCLPWMNTTATYGLMVEKCNQTGFDELPMETMFTDWWNKAYIRYENRRQALVVA